MIGGSLAGDLTGTFAQLFPAKSTGALKPRSIPATRFQVRAADYLLAAIPPSVSGTASGLPSSNFTDTVIACADGVTVTPVASVNAWGSMVFDGNAFGLSYVGNNGNGTAIFEFVTDAPQFSVKATTGHGALQIVCNNEIIYDGSDGPSSGTGSWYSFDWSGLRALRRYMIRGYGLAVGAIRTGDGDSLYAPQDGQGPRVAWMGDSYSQNAGRTGFDTFPVMTCAMLNWKRVFVDARSGSGYAQDNGGATQTFLQRVPAMLAASPDVIVLAGGHNKAAGEDLAASVPAVLNLIRASSTAPIIVIGPFSPSTTYQTSNNADWTKMQTASAATSGCYFIDTRGWITGTGKAGSLAHDGNADQLVLADGTHYNANGAEWVAMRLADAIAAAI